MSAGVLFRSFPLKLLALPLRKPYYYSVAMLLVVLVSGVVLDQLTKQQSTNTLMQWSSPTEHRQYKGSRYPIWSIGDIEQAKTDGPYFELYLSYVRNPGAAWGMLSQLDDAVRVPLFFAVTILCILFIMYYWCFTPISHRLARYALTLILSGAIGNMIDRVRLHYVVDWIGVRWNIGGWYYSFPNFNVADALISVGAALFLIDALILSVLRNRLLEREKQRHDYSDKDLKLIQSSS